MVLLIRGGGKKPVVLIHKLHNNDFDKSVNKKNISWPEYFSFYKATTPLDINYLHLSIHRRTTCNENKLVLKWRITVQATPGHKLIQGNKVKPESFSFPPVANRFFRISRVPQLECRGIDSSNTLIRHVTAIVPFICLEFRTFRSQTNQNPDLASFLKWSHNRSNDGTEMDSTLERHHGRLFQIRSQRCYWNRSGQSDTLLNSSRFGEEEIP